MLLDDKSLAKMKGVHPDLLKVATLAAKYSTTPFRITEGLRSAKRQQELYAQGATRTLNSRHLTGHALDFVPVVGGQVTWKWPAFKPVADAFKRASLELQIPIVWGGDWKSFKDGPHIELDRRHYP